MAYLNGGRIKQRKISRSGLVKELGSEKAMEAGNGRVTVRIVGRIARAPQREENGKGRGRGRGRGKGEGEETVRANMTYVGQ